MQITPYHAKYFAFELTKRSSSDSLQKLASSLLDAAGFFDNEMGKLEMEKKQS